MQDEVTAVDPVQKTVITPSQRIPYDALILAPGGSPAAAGVAGAETHARFFRSADDAETLRLGERAAKNARRYLAGRLLKKFRKDDLPLLVTFGDLSAFVLLEDDTVLEGEVLAAGRELVFQETMATLDDASGPRSLKCLAKRLRAGEERLEWRRSLSPFRAFDHLLGLRVHLGS